MSSPGRPPTVATAELRHQLELVLKTALRISGDKGNIQLLDPIDCTLRIVAQCGFDQDFLDFFGTTHEGYAACGMALLRRERVIVEDVASDPIFAGTEAREVLLNAGVRAVQSTPLLSSSGELLGVFSSHYGTPGRPSAVNLRIIDKLAKHASSLIERALHPDVQPIEAWTAAELQDDGSANGDYSLFCRTPGCASFIESASTLDTALERLKALSLTEAGEFVLFGQFNVVAVSRNGIVELRNSATRGRKALEHPHARRADSH